MAELSDNTPPPEPPESPASDSTSDGAEIDETQGDGETQDTTESEAMREYADQTEPNLDRTEPEEGDIPADEADAEVDAPGVDEHTDVLDADDQDADDEDEAEGGEVETEERDAAAEAQENENGGDAQDKENEHSGMSTGEAAKESAIEIGSRIAGRELGIGRLFDDGIKPFIDTIRALGGPRETVVALRAYASRLFRGGRGGGE